MNDLEKEVKKQSRKHRLANKERRHRILNELDEKLADFGIDGYVVSIICYDFNNKRINCYGQRIEDGAIKRELNQTIGAQGTRTTGTTHYPTFDRLSSYKLHDFRPAERFEIKDPLAYVALVSINQDPDEEISHSHLL